MIKKLFWLKQVIVHFRFRLHLEEELAKGNDNPGIVHRPIGNGSIEYCGKNGGRLYVRESDSVIEILVKSG